MDSQRREDGADNTATYSGYKTRKKARKSFLAIPISSNGFASDKPSTPTPSPGGSVSVVEKISLAAK